MGPPEVGNVVDPNDPVLCAISLVWLLPTEKARASAAESRDGLLGAAVSAGPASTPCCGGAPSPFRHSPSLALLPVRDVRSTVEYLVNSGIFDIAPNRVPSLSDASTDSLK